MKETTHRDFSGYFFFHTSTAFFSVSRIAFPGTQTLTVILLWKSLETRCYLSLDSLVWSSVTMYVYVSSLEWELACLPAECVVPFCCLHLIYFCCDFELELIFIAVVAADAGSCSCPHRNFQLYMPTAWHGISMQIHFRTFKEPTKYRLLYFRFICISGAGFRAAICVVNVN